MDSTMHDRVVAMHALYCKLVNADPDKVRLTGQRIYPWEAWCLRFNEQDLIDLVRHIRSKGTRGRSLLFRSLIAGPSSIEFAEEDLAEARARKPKPTTP